MESRLAVHERHQFSDRLKHALQAAGMSLSPSKVAAEFNLRADGATVTSFAARKWLFGESIPTHERLVILSDWLDVHASWLLYGEAANTDFKRTVSRPSLQADERSLLQDYKRLSSDGRRVVRELMSLLISKPLGDKGQ